MSALVWCPFPDRESARHVSTQLLDEKLVACANMVDGVHALFEWDGERGEGAECGVLFKTHADVLAKAIKRLEALHPYDCPAIMGWRCDIVGSATEAWLGELATGEQET